MNVVCCQGRGLCYGLITHPEQSYGGVAECDREASPIGRVWPTRGYHAIKKNKS